MLHWIRRTIYLVVACALCASCTKHAQGKHSGNSFRLSLKEEPKTLDPRKGGDVISSQMQFLLFEGLVRLQDDRSYKLAQAESFEVSEDNRVYTFHLRDCKWSNGDPVTAYDFEKAWKDVLDPSFPSLNAQLFYPIRNAEKAKKGLVPLSEVGICARDAKTLVVTLDQPTPYFFDLISFCVFFPVHSTIANEDAAWADDVGPHFVSNGPFILKEWKHNDSLLVERNPTYWNQSGVAPEHFHFSIVQNEVTALNMFEQGELDLIGEPLAPIPVDAFASLKKSGKLYTRAEPATTFVTFNTTKSPFNHPKIRKAFAYAIDRQQIVDNISQLDDLAATNFIPPVLKDGVVRSFFKDGDVETAKVLFREGCEELGITPEAFIGVTYAYAHSDLNHKVAQALQRQWAEALGVELKLEGLEFKVLMDKLGKRDYLIAQAFWWAQYNDPMNIFERFKIKETPKNYPHWENARYANLLDASFFAVGDERAALLERAEELFLDEMPLAPIYHWNHAYMLKPPLTHIKYMTTKGIDYITVGTESQ